MDKERAGVGVYVRSNREFADVPEGTVGCIDEVYSSGVMVAWDLKDRPLRRGYQTWDGRPAMVQPCLRDGFAESELGFLDECIRLWEVDGIAKLTGVDDGGSRWTQFEVDHFADQETGECSLCDEPLESGWLCMDGGEEVCSDHVVIRERKL